LAGAWLAMALQGQTSCILKLQQQKTETDIISSSLEN